MSLLSLSRSLSPQKSIPSALPCRDPTIHSSLQGSHPEVLFFVFGLPYSILAYYSLGVFVFQSLYLLFF